MAIFEFIMDCIVLPIADYFTVYRDSVDPQQGLINWGTAILLGLGGIVCLGAAVLFWALGWWLLVIPAGAGCVWCFIKEMRHYEQCVRDRR